MKAHVISHEMICPEESDFSVGFRVIGCGYGAEISSFNAGDRFLESLDFLDRSFFFGDSHVLKSGKILTKWVIHGSLKNTWLFSIMGTEFMV